MKIIKNILATIGIFLFLGFGISSSHLVHSTWYLTDGKEYFAPSCLSFEQIKNFEIIDVQNEKFKNLVVSNYCKNEGAFVEDGRSLTGIFFERIGLLENFRSKRLHPEKPEWRTDSTLLLHIKYLLHTNEFDQVADKITNQSIFQNEDEKEKAKIFNRSCLTASVRTFINSNDDILRQPFENKLFEETMLKMLSECFQYKPN